MSRDGAVIMVWRERHGTVFVTMTVLLQCMSCFEILDGPVTIVACLEWFGMTVVVVETRCIYRRRVAKGFGFVLHAHLHTVYQTGRLQQVGLVGAHPSWIV